MAEWAPLHLHFCMRLQTWWLQLERRCTTLAQRYVAALPGTPRWAADSSQVACSKSDQRPCVVGRPRCRAGRWQADLHLPALPLHWPDPPPPSVGLNVLVNSLCRVSFPAFPPPNTHLPPPQATRSAPSAIVMAVHVTAVDRPILQLLVIAGRPWRGDAKCLLSCCGRLSGGCQLRVGARLCAASFFAATICRLASGPILHRIPEVAMKICLVYQCCWLAAVLR